MKKFLYIILAAAAVTAGFWLFSSQAEEEANNTADTPVIDADAADPAAPAPHPYTIDALRSREYPGGEVVVESSLGDQGSFHTFVVSYPSDGLKLYALMNVPDSPMPDGGFPVIILNHGYIPPTVYSTTTSYRSYMDAYTRQGFLVLKPDYRGHDDSEGEPVSAHVRPDYTVDVLNLVSSVKNIPQANPDAIGMWGHSMGGGITLRAIVVSEDIKAAALLAGVLASPQNFYTYWQEKMNDPRVPSWIRENANRTLEEFGTPQENPDIWNAISPYTYIADINIPVQIHHGTADTDVPIVFSEELDNALTQAGKAVEYFVYPGGDHNLAGNARSPVLNRTYDFFRVHLR